MNDELKGKQPFSSSFIVPHSSFLLKSRAEEEEGGRDDDCGRGEEESGGEMLAARLDAYGFGEGGERGEAALLERFGEDADERARDGVAADVYEDDVERDGHRARARADAPQKDCVDGRVADEEQRHGDEDAGQVDEWVVGD